MRATLSPIPSFRGATWCSVAGSIIRTDALGGVTFRGETVTLLGSVYAPGGSIVVAGSNLFPSIPAGGPLPTVFIGSRVVLSTAGKPVIQIHPNGWRQGQITSGGSINISGNIVAERGAVFDVSGSTGVLDLSPTFLSTSNYPVNSLRGVQMVPVRVDSSGGSIRLAGGELLYSDATLIGEPGGPSAIGGSLTVSSGRFRPAGEPSTSADVNLIVRQSGLTLPSGVRPRDRTTARRRGGQPAAGARQLRRFLVQPRRIRFAHPRWQCPILRAGEHY